MMRPIPKTLKDDIASDPYYKHCARRSGECEGRITWEHAWIYAGRQINEKWTIIPLCWYHHLGSGLNKEVNQYLSIVRASENDLRKYPKGDWHQKRRYLVGKYGTPRNQTSKPQ